MHALRLARATLFAGAFYLTTAAFLIFGSPLLLAPRSWAMAGLRAHARACLWLMRWIAGTSYEIRGREHLPPGACLAVAKHQSAWETFALIPVFRDPAIVMKEELTRIPVYGWFCRKFEHVLVKRERRAAALKGMVELARRRATAGREILIFAEGTRTEPGAAPDYKPGFVALYQALDLPMIPIALNSGLYWPRRSGLCFPGHIVVEILPPIPPGLPRDAARTQAVTAIEDASRGLVLEAVQRGDAPAATREALARMTGPNEELKENI